jgi:hypothetical protein
MRTISIQADGGPGGNDDVMRGALRCIVTNMPVSGKGFKFDGDLHTGTTSTTATRANGWSASGPSCRTAPAAAATPTPTPWCGRSSSASTTPTEGGTHAHSRHSCRPAHRAVPDRVAQAITRFAAAYADQNERAHQSLLDAVAAGRLTAEPGM